METKIKRRVLFVTSVYVLGILRLFLSSAWSNQITANYNIVNHNQFKTKSEDQPLFIIGVVGTIAYFAIPIIGIVAMISFLKQRADG